MGRISQRVEAIAESATLAITSKAAAMRAEGIDVIGFGAGEPDFPTPAHIVQAAAAACREARFHHYTPSAGLPELRQAVATKTERDSAYAVEASQVLITNGGKHAVFNACATVLEPGDEVLLPAPYWVTYPEALALAGAVAVPVPSDAERGFRVDIAALEQATTARTAGLIFVSPSNPTGSVYPPEEIAAIGHWAAERGLWVITDEIYEHLVYGDSTFSSMPALVPELRDHCIVVNGVSKTYAMTGWRVGWMIGPPDVVRAAANLQSHSTSNVSNIAQAAALAAVAGDLATVAEMRSAFDRRRGTMHRMLDEIPGVTCVEPQGAFYAFPSLAGLLERPIRGRTAATTLELAALVLEEARVAIVPGEAFGAPGFARFSYALSDEDLKEGLSRFAALAGE